jgi:hypothetical protein
MSGWIRKQAPLLKPWGLLPPKPMPGCQKFIIRNSKMRMPTILPNELAWEWMMMKPVNGKLTSDQKDRLSTIALTQIPSGLLDYCTIDSDYRHSHEANRLDYPELNSIPYSNFAILSSLCY